jgi:deoxyribodipyrimidine photo-lyase
VPDAVCWLRRDLRLDDNEALAAAIDHASDAQLLVLYVIDPHLWSRSGDPRRVFLLRALSSLRESLDGRLAIRVGDPTSVVGDSAGGAPVFCAEDFAPYGRQRDAAVAASGVDLRPTGSAYAVAPGTVMSGSGTPYKVFTPFSRAWAAFGWSSPVRSATALASAKLVDAKQQDALPESPDIGSLRLPPASESAALEVFAEFKKHRLVDYVEARNMPGVEGTSRLSAALRWGLVHPRTLLAQLGDSKAESVFRSELAWREFYADVLFHNPSSAREDLTATLANLDYDSGAVAEKRFEAWCNGATGYPIVDAGMRQLLAEGFMHNRVRMIVASFLVKDLHLHWSRGARWFMKHLVDGDLASNQHGWQWTAGTGTDAAPYFRVFNPVSQGKKFDPDAVYVKRWVPELAHLPANLAHEPWLADGAVSNASLFAAEAKAYPSPIVDHADERRETLRRYELARRA